MPITSPTNLYSNSQYIVDSSASGSPYTTIQAALTAANTDGGNATVKIRHESLTEDLTLYDSVFLEGDTDNGTIIIGTHTPPASGTLHFKDIDFQDATAVLSSAAAGTTDITFENCTFTNTNGFSVDLLNWTGSITLLNCRTAGTNDGIVNNTGGSSISIVTSTLGNGVGQTAVVSGNVTIQNSNIKCPISFQGTGTSTADIGTKFDGTVTTAATHTLTINNGVISTGATAAISHGSANDLTLSHVTIDSSNATPIGGAGGGELILGTVDFLGTTTIASTLTVTSPATINKNMHGWNGSILESPAVTITSDGATITLSVQKSGGGNLTVITSKGFFDWTTAPDTITLTAGTDTTPQINYIYWLESTRALTNSTSAFPSGEHAPIATVFCQSAASLQTDGAYKVHAWTDHLTRSDDQGHVGDLNYWIRNQNATWQSGVNPTLTITTNAGSADNVIFTSLIGNVLQLHDHNFPSFAGTPDVYVVNDFTTPYTKVTDLNALLTDSTNASMSGRRFSLVIWGVVSESTGDCKLMVNLPSGTYGNNNALLKDNNKYADFSIPSEFIGTGFLIAELNLRHQTAASGTWTEISIVDLRGLYPSIAAGGQNAQGTEFSDDVFRILDDIDNTKEIAFQASGITTATTRTMTVPDADGTIAYSTSLTANGMAYASDGDTITSTLSPTDGQILIGDTGSIPLLGTIASADASVTITNGAGTIDLSVSSGGITWTEVTSATQAAAVDNGYITNLGAGVTVTLPDTAALGSVVRIAGKLGNWILAQNAGETVHFGNQDTTTGAGGSLTATDASDSIELVCTTADTDWTIISSVGNITVT